MALVPCSECGNPVAYSAPACPKCGNLDPSGRVRKSKFHAKLLGLAMIVVSAGLFWFVAIPMLQQTPFFHQVGQHR